MTYSDADSEDAFKAIKILAKEIGDLPGRKDKEMVDRLNEIIDLADGGEISDRLIYEIHPDWADEDEEET